MLQSRWDTELRHGTTETKGVGWTWEKARIEETSTHSTFSRLCTRLLVDCVADCFVLLPFSNFVFLDLSHLKYPKPRFKECDKETQFMSRVRYNKTEVAEAVTALAVPKIMIFSMFYKTRTRFTEVATYTPLVGSPSNHAVRSCGAVSRMKWFYIL